MSNLERDPVELLCPAEEPIGPAVQVLEVARGAAGRSARDARAAHAPAARSHH